MDREEHGVLRRVCVCVYQLHSLRSRSLRLLGCFIRLFNVVLDVAVGVECGRGIEGEVLSLSQDATHTHTLSISHTLLVTQYILAFEIQ